MNVHYILFIQSCVCNVIIVMYKIDNHKLLMMINVFDNHVGA